MLNVTSPAGAQLSSPTSITVQFVRLALGIWLLAVLVLGARGFFVQPAGAPPLPIFAGAMVPLIAFALALRSSPAFSEFVLSLDLRLIAALQAWRFAGLDFIAMYANHLLPGLFAWPAGLGDMAIAMFAPWWVMKLSNDPGAARSGQFRLWNVLGILDLVVAVATAAISAVTITQPGAATMGPMAELPLVLIPTFLVPLFVMLHVAALLQTRQARP